MRRPLAAILLAAAPAAAQDAAFLSDAGAAYVEVEAAAGAAIRSTAPVTHRIGAAGREVSGVETITLLPDCAASSNLLGEGTWGWANGGWGAVFGGPAPVMFARQEPPAGAGPGCRW